MVKRRSLWILLAALLVIAGVGAAVMKKRAEAAVQPSAATTAPVLEFLPTDIIQVTPRNLQQTLPLSGSLRAVNQVSVKARIAGEVREVLVREGETVKAGQVLVRMDTREYQARLDQAKGALQAARGQLEISSKARDNNQALFAKGFISQNAFDNTASQYSIALANVESAKGALDVVQKMFSDTVIQAPISGLVSSRTIQPGEKVSADNRLLDVVDLEKMELEAAVPTSEIMRVSQGQEVMVKVEGLSQALPGKVVRINPAIQSGSRSILVYIQLDNPERKLRVGMFGDAKLVLAKKAGVIAVPQSALQSVPQSLQQSAAGKSAQGASGSAFVYAIEQDKLVQKPVTLGISGKADDAGNEAIVEITGGLENGAQIIRNNLGNLKAGTSVRFAKNTASNNQTAAGNTGPNTAAAAASAPAAASAVGQ